MPGNIDIASLLQHVERLEIEPGTTIISRGKPIDAFFYIESGQVTTRREGFCDFSLDMEIVKNGQFLGDIGFYLGHTSAADFVADETCIIYRFSVEKLTQLEKKNPEVTSMLHEIMVRLLAERITHLIKTVNLLQK